MSPARYLASISLRGSLAAIGPEHHREFAACMLDYAARALAHETDRATAAETLYGLADQLAAPVVGGRRNG